VGQPNTLPAQGLMLLVVYFLIGIAFIEHDEEVRQFTPLLRQLTLFL
jgi:hypothetical protein